jgi:uncharacterized membrane protein
LPDPIEWYLRPVPNRTTFTLFPWAGFLTGGALAGELLEAVRGESGERRLQAWLFVAGLAGIAGGYVAALQPSIYANAQFWTSSPTFFFIRLGIVVMSIPVAWAIGLAWEPLVTLGRSSLFVYWIHVEMVYGALTLPLRHLLPWELSVSAAIALSAVLYALVNWKNRWVTARPLPQTLRVLTPILK